MTTDAPKPLAGDYAIEFQNVTRRFRKQVAVNDFTLRVARGKTLGFVGLNGAGKTTAIRMAVGLLAPTSGTIRVAGCEVPRERDRLKPLVGYVPDRPTVYPWMRVREAIAFCRTFYPRYNDARVNELMQLMDLDPSKQIKYLSKGNAAKVSLLLAVGHDPQVLLLDEPTSGLDPLAREQFLEGIIHVAGSLGQTVLFSSHALADVTRVADEVAIMHEGKLLVNSPIADLLASTKRLRAVLEDGAAPNAAPAGTIWQQTIGREWSVTVQNFQPDTVQLLRTRSGVAHVEVEDVTLDQLFKDLIRGRQSLKKVSEAS